MTNKELKTKSKEQLKGRKIEFGIITLVELLLIGGGIYLGKECSSLLESFLTSILTIVFASIYLQFARTNKYTVLDGLKNWKAWLRDFVLKILLALIASIAIALIMFIMLFVNIAMFKNAVESGLVMTSAAVIVMIAVTIVLCVIGIVIALSLSQYNYFLVDGSKTFECLGNSMRVMKGHKWELFCLGLSFIGWYLLSILTLGILLLWVMPYASVTYSNFYRDRIGEFDNVEQPLEFPNEI